MSSFKNLIKEARADAQQLHAKLEASSAKHHAAIRAEHGIRTEPATLVAGLYAPLRVILYETENGGSRLEYDLPSSLFAQFDDDCVNEVARGLDDALKRALTTAAG
jgi:hypothetical protein